MLGGEASGAAPESCQFVKPAELADFVRVSRAYIYQRIKIRVTSGPEVPEGDWMALCFILGWGDGCTLCYFCL